VPGGPALGLDVVAGGHGVAGGDGGASPGVNVMKQFRQEFTDKTLTKLITSLQIFVLGSRIATPGAYST
jgi:hypothetical protein